MSKDEIALKEINDILAKNGLEFMVQHSVVIRPIPTTISNKIVKPIKNK